MNVILGYAGQISLGHQAFVGIGAFMASYVTTKLGLDFVVAVPAAALSGAVAALILGAAALRIGGLLLALVTLTYGAVAERTIFLFGPFTGGGSGAPAPKPQWALVGQRLRVRVSRRAGVRSLPRLALREEQSRTSGPGGSRLRARRRVDGDQRREVQAARVHLHGVPRRPRRRAARAQRRCRPGRFVHASSSRSSSS